MRKQISATPLSVLDLVLFPEGGSIADAFAAADDIARHAEALGYRRYWLAEHHNIDGVASAATAVLIGHIAGKTKHIRVGSGGIMLPNHATLAIAEQFGTLATLYPGRIDLGLGRAPGGDRLVMQALRTSQLDFGELLEELEFFFSPPQERQALKAIPGAGLDVPWYILGSSLYSAHLAARLGRPYAFASHFAPAQLQEAVRIYRQEFQPSPTLAEPYVLVGVPVVAAATDERAEFLATTVYQRFLGLVRGQRIRRPAPVASMAGLWTEQEKAAVFGMLAVRAVGSPGTVKAQLQELVETTGADELIVLTDLYEHADRRESLAITAAIAGCAHPTPLPD